VTVDGPVLVDDLGLWLTRVLDDHWDSPDARSVFAGALTELLDAWQGGSVTAVLVAPEVGSGVVPATASASRRPARCRRTSGGAWLRSSNAHVNGANP